MESDYSKLLKSPKWQKKRLEIMQRDNFTCQCCFDKQNELTVHHKYYTANTKPWDYKDDCYITLCVFCHDNIHIAIKNYPRDSFNIFSSSISFAGVNATDYYIFSNHFQSAINRFGINGFKHIFDTVLTMIINEEDL